MFSYPHRLKSGQITCYLNRTYHVLTTQIRIGVDGTPVQLYACDLGVWIPLRQRSVQDMTVAAARIKERHAESGNATPSLHHLWWDALALGLYSCVKSGGIGPVVRDDPTGAASVGPG